MITIPDESIFSSADRESAELRLALLKENFVYRDFFERLAADPYATCPELRQPEESIEDYQTRVHLLELKRFSFFGGCATAFGIFDKFLIATQRNPSVPLGQILTLLDPRKNPTDVQCPPLVEKLPILFYSPGIHQPHPRTLANRVPWEQMAGKDETNLQPYQLVLMVDLRKKKTELKEGFGRIIDAQLKTWAAGARLQLKTYLSWQPDNRRERKEAWQQLKVWRLRKQRKSFWWISKELRISEDLAKKRFYRAYELTQGEHYNSERYQSIGWSLQKRDLLKSCDNCEDKGCLSNVEKGLEWVPCPEILLYIEQDQVKLQERIPRTPL